MKPVYCFRVLSLLLALWVVAPAWAQPIEGPVGVAVTIKALDIQWGYNYGGYFELSIDGLNGYQMISAAYDTETPQLTARLEPGKAYYVSVSSEDVDNLTIQAVPPPGYVMEIERVARERLSLGYGGYASVQIRVLSPMQQFVGRAGAATALMSGRIFWQVALGSLANGSSAGTLAIIDTGSSSFSSLFTPAGFLYEPTSSEVQVFYTPWNVSAPEIPGSIRQIIAPEACVDIITVGPNEAHIKFYHRGQLLANPSSGLRWFSGAPYAWYLINQDGVQPNRVYINCDIRELPNLTDTNAPVVQTKHTMLERTGTAPNFTWTADEWYTGATSLSRDVRVRSGTNESITVSQPGGATSTSRTRIYGSVPWGEEIMSESAGTTNTVTTTNEFYTTSDQTGNYGRPRSTITTGGSWEAYEYYDYAGDSADVAGALYRSHRSFLNSSTTVPADLATHTGVITTYTYLADAFGRKTRPNVVTTTVGGVQTSKSVTSYTSAASGFTGHPSLYIVTANNNMYASSAAALTTISKYFREDAGANYTYPTDDFFRGQPHSIRHPDGRKQSFAHQRGSWNGTTFTASANGGANHGASSRLAVISGNATTGTLYTAYAGYDIDDLYLVDGKSTIEIIIRDASALVRRTETHVWSSSVWNLVSAINYGYNYSNQLISRTSSANGRYDAVYTGEYKDWEKDDGGIRIDYIYDAAGRVSIATKSSGPKNTFTYDAEHRPLSETVSAVGTGETIYSRRTYDDAGRLKTELPPGMATINYSYNAADRTRTTTYPDASTRIETFYADGQLKQVDGTAVIPQYNAFTIETDGRRTAQTNVGSSSSARWQKGITDWLGRPTHAERPGFSVSSQAVNAEDSTYEAGTGRLIKTTRTGFAPSLYGYDALGNVTRSGLDMGNGGSLVLASADRIADTDTFFEYYSSAWWLKSTSKAYPFADSATPVTTSTKRTRLTGHPAGRMDETQVTDAEGNTVTRTVDVNRITATATITTTSPSVANTRVEIVVNGLATSVTGYDGLTTSAQYDLLGRAWKATDPRNNTYTTTYKYGTTLVQSIADGAGNSQGIVSYDDMGRKQWVKDAAEQYTRFTYNLRGQLTHQWGGGSHPISYGYDPTYGENTTLSTYRNAPAGDSAAWPSVGAADTTVWTYDGASALLWKKTDASNQVTEFDYNVRGQTSTRKWARKLASAGMITTPVTTNYGYDGNTGELLTLTYNDAVEVIPTPPITYTYSRLGQVKTVDDATGLRTFNYNASSPWRMDNETLDASFYASRIITRNYDGASGTGGVYGQYTPGFLKGRYSGYDLGVPGHTARDQHIAYCTSNLGRFVGVITRATSGAARDYVYNYINSSSLLGGYVMGSSFTVTRGYEPQRNVLTSIDSQWGGYTRSRYDYTTNSLGQRTTAKQKGSAFADYVQGLTYSATYNVYNYNTRGELQASVRYRGDNPSTSPSSTDELPAQRFEYRYDSIGNRTTSGASGTASDDSYTRNGLNQYTARENKTVKVLGTANVNANVAVSGALSTGKKDHAWGADLVPANTGGPVKSVAAVYSALPGGGAGGADLVRTDGSRSYFVPKRVQVIDYDADGNTSSDETWTYTYNAENQLVRMNTLLDAGFTGMNLRIDFKYDYQGRRVEKSVFDYSTNTLRSAHRYLYDGPNLIAETDTSGTLKRVFTWGLDLAASLSATGGVGALIQIDDFVASKTLCATYDGNGNIATLLNAITGGLEAAYEYDPYGNLLRAEGAYAKSNPFRFSTKWQDDETGLINYGFRYYSSTLGRFINRDPIAEKGGLNLYGFCGNDGINRSDYLGMSWLSKSLRKLRKWTSKHTEFSVFAASATLNPLLVHYAVRAASQDVWAAAKKNPEIAAVVAGIATAWMGGWGAAAFGVAYGTTANVVIAGAAGGFGSGFVGTRAAGGSISQALRAGAYGAAAGAVFAYAGSRVNEGINNWQNDRLRFYRVDANPSDPTQYLAPVEIAQSEITGNVTLFENGILNHLENAAKNGWNHVSGKSFILAHNESHGFIADIVETGLGKLTGTSSLGSHLAEVLKQINSSASSLYLHSQGAQIGMNALQVLAQQGVKLAGLSVHGYGGATNLVTSRSIVESVGAKWTGWVINPFDPVPNIVGMNALFAPHRLVTSLVGAPFLFSNPRLSPHTLGSGNIWSGFNTIY